MDSKTNVGDAKTVIAVSKAMSGARTTTDADDALNDARERLRRVMDSIDLGLATSAPRPLTARQVEVVAASSISPSPLSSRPPSSHSSIGTAPPPPAVTVPPLRRPAAEQCVADPPPPPPPPQPTAAMTPSSSVDSCEERTSAVPNNPLPPQRQQHAPLAPLPDASALLERWLLQDSQLDNSPIRAAQPLVLSAAYTTITTTTKNPSAVFTSHIDPTADDSLFVTHTRRVDGPKSSGGIFSESAEALWSSALLGARRTMTDRTTSEERAAAPGLSAAANARLSRFVVEEPRATTATLFDSHTSEHARGQPPSSSVLWRPTNTPAVQPSPPPRADTNHSSATSTWQPSSLFAKLDDGTPYAARPRRAAPLATSLPSSAQGAHVDAWPSHSPAALHDTTDEDADRLFSILSARYGFGPPSSSAPPVTATTAAAGTVATEAPVGPPLPLPPPVPATPPPASEPVGARADDNQIRETQPHAAPDTVHERIASSSTTSTTTSSSSSSPSTVSDHTPLSEAEQPRPPRKSTPAAGQDGMVCSPPRPYATSTATQTDTSQLPTTADDSMPSLLDVLHRRFHDQASSILEQCATDAQRRLTDGTSPRRSRFGTGRARSLTAFSEAHSALLGRDAEEVPCAHEAALRQSLMEERIRRTRREGSARGSDATRTHRTPTAGYARPFTHRNTAITRTPTTENALARYRARREAIEAEDNEYLGALATRYAELVGLNSDGGDQPPCEALNNMACSDAGGAGVRDVGRHPSPAPREAADVQRRVQLLRQLTGSSPSDAHDVARTLASQPNESVQQAPSSPMPTTVAEGHAQPSPASRHRGSASGELEIPTPTREQIRAASADRSPPQPSPPYAYDDDNGNDGDDVDPLSIEREPTPERSVAPPDLAHRPPVIEVLHRHQAEREWSPDADDDEGTQRPPPPRPARRAPRRADCPAGNKGDADGAVRTPSRAATPSPEERLYVSPTRRGASLGASSASSSASSSSSLLRKASKAQIEQALRAQLARQLGGQSATQATSARLPPPPPQQRTATASPVVTRQHLTPSSALWPSQPSQSPARSAERDRLAAVGVQESIRLLQQRGVQVSVQLARSHVPAHVQLSRDQSELLFILHKHTTADHLVSADANSSVSRPPSVTVSAPSRRSSSSSVRQLPAPVTETARRTASPRTATGAAGLVLNTAAASNRFATPPKSLPAHNNEGGASAPPAPQGAKKKVLMRLVRTADGRTEFVPVGPSPPATHGPDTPLSVPVPQVVAPERQQRTSIAYARSPLPRRETPLMPGSTSSPASQLPRRATDTPHSSSGPPSVISQRTASYCSGPASHHHAGGPPLSLPASAAAAQAQRRPTVSGDSGTALVQVRERHHFPLRNARLLLPGHVLGCEQDQGRAGPGSFEDVSGVLCGPAACEVLRRYRCTLFADTTQSGLRTYRLFLVIPEFKRIDIPENAVLLVVDCRSRADWVVMVLALQGLIYGEPNMSYGRALWLLAAHRCRYAHALKGLNPFETGKRFAAAIRAPKERPNSIRASGGVSPQRNRTSTSASPPLSRPSVRPRQAAPRRSASSVTSSTATATSATSLLYRNALPPRATAPPQSRRQQQPQPQKRQQEAPVPTSRADTPQAPVTRTSGDAAANTPEPTASSRRASSVQALRKLFSRPFRSHRSAEDPRAMKSPFTESARECARDN